MPEVKIWINMSELGAGVRGTCNAFEALQLASVDTGSILFEESDVEEIKNFNSSFDSSIVNPFAKRLPALVKTYSELCDKIGTSDKFPVIISGDHSSCGGTVAALKKANPNKSIGIIWIDAHADLHSPYTSHSGNTHGMPVACMLQEDNKENAFREIDQETISGWDELKAVGGDYAKIGYSDIVQYAVRETEWEEDLLIENNAVKAFSVNDIRKQGAVDVITEGLAYLEKQDLIYISFDVDSMDPSISRGTGTPVDEGVTELEAEQMILKALEDPRVCCLEITEINPVIDDKGNAMAETAFRILEKAVRKIEQL
ncbi:MAG: arginase [Flavobacteriales bacterium]|nr:arginase [Flavobacteriales bacterium]